MSDDFFDDIVKPTGNHAAIERNELLNVMRTADGRAVLWRLLNEGGLNDQTFVGENPLQAAFRSGKREVVLQLWRQMRSVDLGLVRVMEDEGIERERVRKGGQ